MNIFPTLGHVGALITCQRAVTTLSSGDRNPTTLVVTQIAALSIAFTIVGETLEAFRLGPIPALCRYACYLSPAVLAYATHRGISNERAKQVVLFLQDALVPLCQIAAVASAVGMLYLGFTAVGMTSLLVTTVGVAEQRGWVTKFVRARICTWVYPVLDVCGVFSPNWCARMNGVLSVGGLLVGRMSRIPQQANDPIGNDLSFEELRRMLPAGQRWSQAVTALSETLDRSTPLLATVAQWEEVAKANPDQLADRLRACGNPYWNASVGHEVIGYGRRALEEIGTLAPQPDSLMIRSLPPSVGLLKKLEGWLHPQKEPSLVDVVSSSRESGAEVRSWWTQWLDRQPLGAEQKEAIRQELMQNKILSHYELVDREGRIAPPILLAMLCSQGKLRVSRNVLEADLATTSDSHRVTTAGALAPLSSSASAI